MSEIHVDGNALGGLFQELFGQEMTHRRGCCGECGNVSEIASALVYRGPGDVLRCSACRNVLMVIVPSSRGHRVIFESLRWIALGDPVEA